MEKLSSAEVECTVSIRRKPHVETNQLTNLLEDLSERTEALRGYL